MTPFSRSSFSCHVWNARPPGMPTRASVIGMPSCVLFSTCARTFTPSPILTTLLSIDVATDTFAPDDDCGFAAR